MAAMANDLAPDRGEWFRETDAERRVALWQQMSEAEREATGNYHWGMWGRAEQLPRRWAAARLMPKRAPPFPPSSRH